MITIIDYGIGNLGSVANTLDKLGNKYQITDKPRKIQEATALILPGVGAALEGMENLKKRKLDKIIIEKLKTNTPFLGICLGMQLLFESSEEGNVKCLSILKGKVKRFEKMKKVPQIGWNQVAIQQCNNVTTRLQTPERSDGGQVKQLLKNIKDNSNFYFVNSYYCIPENQSIIAGISEYGEKFASIIVKNNILATQFHPEKSGIDGLQLLKNFINLC